MIQVALCMVHPHDPLGEAIMALTRAGYCHAEFWWTDATGKVQVLENYAPKARQRDPFPNERNGVDLFDIKGLTPELETTILAAIQRRIAAGEPYSIPNLFRFLPFVRPLIGEAKDDGSVTNPTICSQFVFNVLQHDAGIPVFSSEVNAYEVDPAHLAWSTALLKVLRP